MINPDGDEFAQDDPLAAATGPGQEKISTRDGRFRSAARKVSDVAEDTWDTTRQRMGTARERTEFFLRENPVPTVLGALALGLAIGLAIRYSSRSEPEIETKNPLANVNLGVLSLPFLWPFFKSVRNRYEESAEVVKEGVTRLKKVEVDRYVKPLRKKWKAWAN